MKTIVYASIPILFMIGSLPIVQSELARSAVFVLIVLISMLVMKARKPEWFLFVFGFVIMSFFEYIFVATHVETFLQHSYLGVMPLWLPVLWGYSFVAMKKGIRVIESKL